MQPDYSRGVAGGHSGRRIAVSLDYPSLLIGAVPRMGKGLGIHRLYGQPRRSAESTAVDPNPPTLNTERDPHR